MADGVQILLGGEHRIDYVSTFPFNVLTAEGSHLRGHPYSKGDVVIGNDVWIGLNTLILSGVTVGDGAVIGAGSVVTKEVPPYGVAVGNPARVVKKRFAEETIATLLEIRWWDWDERRIINALPLICSDDLDAFLKAARSGSI